MDFIVLDVKKYECPSSKLLCYESNECIDSLEECKNEIVAKGIIYVLQTFI